LKSIFPELTNDLKLNLSSFHLPEVQLGSTTPSYLSKRVDVPTRILNPENQEITFEYLLSSNFHQYIMLYRWVQKIAVEMQQNTNFIISEDQKNYQVPLNIFLLSEFKTPILKITYNNAWIQRLGELTFDYRVPSDEAITHSFTIKYTWFSIETLVDVNGSDGRETTIHK
jgi:hypothetical protein